MCGISGFNFNNKELIVKMTQSLKHRGPDNTGYFFDDAVSLGHNRLSIIDLSTEANQPMFSRNNDLVITYNGELYNYLEIKQQLQSKGRLFRTKSDTEVILQAYEEYGVECLRYFDGIFSFAIWNKLKKELFLARDHFGIKPLFYYYDGKSFIFSSEVKAILEHDVGRDINILALNLYFRNLYILGPETIWKNIYKLPPASYLIYRNHNIQITKYWKIDNYSNTYSYADAMCKIRKTLKASVKRQMISDVPLGLFLSGGIDSTILLGIMSEISELPTKTFSIGYETDVGFDRFNKDLFLARKTAKYYNADHHEVFLKERDIVDNLDKVTWHMDELVYSPTQIATYVLAKVASNHVKVILGGDGGDELFGGYSRYYYQYLYNLYNKLPTLIKKNKVNAKAFELLRRQDLYRRLNMPQFDLFWSFISQNEKMVSKVIQPGINNILSASNYFRKQSGFDSLQVNDFSKKSMKLDLDSWLVDYSLVRSDKMTMAWGLEQRVPILDKDLARLAMKLPSFYKIYKADQGKVIFKKAFKNYIPDNVYKTKKSGWFLPVSKWLRSGRLKDMAYEILSENYNPKSAEYINFSEVRKILDDHISGKQYALNTIWSVINFQSWYRQYHK